MRYPEKIITTASDVCFKANSHNTVWMSHTQINGTDLRRSPHQWNNTLYIVMKMVSAISTTKMTRGILPMWQPSCDPGPLFNPTTTWLILPVHYGFKRELYVLWYRREVNIWELQVLLGSPKGIFTLSFAPFGHSGRVTQKVFLWIMLFEKCYIKI